MSFADRTVVQGVDEQAATSTDSCVLESLSVAILASNPFCTVYAFKEIRAVRREAAIVAREAGLIAHRTIFNVLAALSTQGKGAGERSGPTNQRTGSLRW